MRKPFLHVREKNSSRASIHLAVFIASVAIILLSAIAVRMPQAVNAQPFVGQLALCPENVSWQVGSEPAGKCFVLQMNVTDVTNIYGLPLISVHWNTTLFNLTSCTFDATCIFGTPMAPKPPGTGGTSIMGPPANIYEAIGNMSGTSYTELFPFVPLNFTSPTWGKVCLLNFSYTGPTPTIGSPIDSDILIVDEPWVHPGPPYHKMGTKWANTTAMYAPAYLGKCRFHYQVVETKHHDVEGFDVVTVSKSSVSKPTVNTTLKAIEFNVTGQAGMTSFCNATIPKDVIKGVFNVTVNGAVPLSLSITENLTHTFVDFTYMHASTSHVIIEGTWVVPEFPPLIFLLLLMIATIAATMVGKKVWPIKRRGQATIK